MALITWIERKGSGRLGVMARPGRQDHLEDDLRQVKEHGADEIISLMTPDEMEEAKLHDEKDIAERLGLKFKRFPIADHGTPPLDSGTMDFLDARLHDLKQGKNVVFHCSSGRGRTTLMAASLLVMEGIHPDKAIQLVRSGRLTPVPDEHEQTDWIRQLSANLGRPVQVEEEAEQKGTRSYLKVALAAAGIAALAAVGFWGWRRRVS